MNTTSRRRFLRRSLLATTCLGLPARAWSQVAGANDAIRMAVVGFRSRGRDHLEGFRRLPGVRVAALCDVDEAVLAQGAKTFSDRGETVAAFQDVRRVLERSDVDAISTATPNHWHALIAIWACQAGKDVYVEKPVSHNVWEGRQIVRAARRHGRIVQAGTQSRSRDGVRELMADLHAGRYGPIRLVRGLCYKPRRSIGKVAGPQPIPSGIDYDLWCGPAPKKPLRRGKLHYDWHWVYDTGNGDLGNQGIHEMDLGRWALGQKNLPPRVLSVGGRFGYDDDGETPNTQFVWFDYPVPFLFEVRGLPRGQEYRGESWSQNMDAAPGVPDRRGIGTVIHTEQATLFIPSESAPLAFAADGKPLKTYPTGGNHFANFIQAVRSRKVSELTADIEEGHLSSALCHLGLASHRAGRRSAPEAIREGLEAQKDLGETWGRFREHLAANGVNLETTPATLGAWLRVDPATERLLAPAHVSLTREYRAPFLVPENV